MLVYYEWHLSTLRITAVVFELLAQAEFYARPSGTSNFAIFVR